MITTTIKTPAAVGTTINTGINKPVTWSDVLNKPTEFAPQPHQHSINDVQLLQQRLDEKQPAGSYASMQHQHTMQQVDGLAEAILDISNQSIIHAIIFG